MTYLATAHADYQTSKMTKREERRQFDDRLGKGMMTTEMLQRAKIRNSQAFELMLKVNYAYREGRATERSCTRAMRIYNGTHIYLCNVGY